MVLKGGFKIMKMNIKKVATVLGSALMLGATVGMAAAAAYPVPFVQNGAANVAIVYGANAANADILASSAIATGLATTLAAQTATGATTSTSTVEGGDSVKIEGSSSKFGLGDLASTVLVTSINSEKMPNLLMDGTYTDEDNTEFKYTQKISLGGAMRLNHFSDSDYKDKVPSIGINLSDSPVLNYTLDFDTNPLFNASTMETTTINMMGKQYYVLDVQNGSTDKLTLLDSANSAVITEGETTTVGTYEISINFIDSTKVKLMVNGQTTNSLSNGATYKLSDGTYIGVKDILYATKDAGVSKVEISIGKGKLEVEDGAAIQLNDNTINEITGFLNLDSSSKLDKLVLVWTTDGDEFITADSSITMPGFESIKITMADFFAPKQEVTSVKNSGSNVLELKTTIKGGDVTIPILYATNGIYSDAGKDASNQLAGTTVGNAGTFVFNQTDGDKYIVASWNSTTEAETYYLRVEMIQEDSVNKTRFTNVLNSDDTKTASAGNDVSFGNVVITPSLINYTGSLKLATLTAGAGVSFNSVYTAEGMKVYLPYVNATTVGNIGNYTTAALACTAALSGKLQNELYTGIVTYNLTGSTVGATTSCTTKLYFSEEDKDSNLAKNGFSLTLQNNTDGKVEVKGVNSADVDRTFEIGDTESYESYMISDLATKIVQKTSGDQDSAEITYAGGQSYANAYIASPSATVSAGSGSTTDATQLGTITVKDSEVSSVSGKNLIVIGGSCVNSVAADLLGGAACEAAFTAKTGIKAGEALIQSFAKGDKIALLVAGYNAEDTTKAATYLVNKGFDTTVGKALKVTSATEATAITA